MTDKRRILITGATGDVGTVLVDRLSERYDIVHLDRDPAGAPAAGPAADSTNDSTADAAAAARSAAAADTAADPATGKVFRADITRYDEVLPAMDGIDTVVHLAGAASPDSTWDDVLSANIVGFRNVIEAARVAGVRRFVFASSNHAMGMYDRLEEWPVYASSLPRPDSLYGVSKVFGETLGRYYHDEYGMDVISLRIGWSSGDPTLTDEEILHAMWLSEDDTAHAVERAIEAEVRYGIYYVVSDNPNRRWDITNTMLELGYRPKDSWLTYAERREEVVDGGAAVRDDWPRNS